MKYVVFDPVTINEFDSTSGTVYGHANAAGAEAVGAAFYGNTPAFGVSPPILEGFSSAGPTPILFETDGTPTSEIRDKPEIVGPDGGNTTFFSSDIPQDPDTFPNFFGTSASAPHVAAVAALMLQADSATDPELVYAVLEATAIDMDDPFTPGFDAGFDFGTGFGLVQADLAVHALLPELVIAKGDAPDPVALGGTLTYTLAVTNVGTATSTLVKIKDTLPGGVSFVSATTTAGTVSQSGSTVTFDLGDLAPGGMATGTLVVVPTVTGTITNTASVSSNEPLPNTTHGTSTQQTFVPALVLTKNDAPDPVTLGDHVTYTLTVTNVGAATSTAVTITDTLPGGVSFISATTTAGTVSQSGSTVTFDLGDLAPGGTATSTIVVVPTAVGTITNTASVSSDEPLPDTIHNSITQETTVVPALAITKEDAPDPVVLGATITYTLTVTNVGAATSTAVTITDTLADGVNFVSATTTAGSVSQSGNTVIFDLGALGPGITTTSTLIVIPTAVGTITNTANVSANEPLPNTVHDTITQQTTVTPALVITKDGTPDPVALGGTLTYTLTVTNVSTVTSTAVTITDTLADGVDFVSATTTAGTVSQSGSTVTFDLDDLAPGSMATGTLVVIPTLTGTITNTASVSSDEPFPNTTHGTSTRQTFVPALVIAKGDAPDPVALGGTLTYTLTVTNVGTATSTLVKIKDTLPGGVNFVSATTTAGTVSQSGSTVTFDLGDLAPGGMATGTLVVVPTVTGTITNTASDSSTRRSTANSSGNSHPASGAA